LHEVGVAFDFLYQFRGKIPIQKIFLDTVDLEYRRHFQMGAVKMADESVKKLIALSKYTDKTILITNEEKTLHSQLVSNENVKNYVLSNIYEEFRPVSQAKSLDSKYELLFVGNFLHLPNIDALDFLLDSIISELSGIRIGVVGPNLPIDYVNKINSYKEQDISYLGQVRDISSIYQVSKVVIAPLRLGAGIKGKVLEALQHGKTVVGTTIAWEGIPNLNASVKYEANSGPEFASAIKMALSNDAVLNEQDCQLLNSVFSRKKSLENLMEIMEVQ
jgi:glycosyltransferase involved in cell wall biosynthesis